jgi:hypothetical protein
MEKHIPVKGHSCSYGIPSYVIGGLARRKWIFLPAPEENYAASR